MLCAYVCAELVNHGRESAGELMHRHETQLMTRQGLMSTITVLITYTKSDDANAPKHTESGNQRTWPIPAGLQHSLPIKPMPHHAPLKPPRTPTPPTLEAYHTLPLSLPHATPPPQPT